MQLVGEKKGRTGTRARGRRRSAPALREEREFLLENFAVLLAHELSAPLAALQQSLYAMTEGPSTAPERGVRDRLVRIRSRVDDLMKTVRAWLKAAVSDPAAAREDFRPLPVSRLLSRAAEVLRPLADRKGVEVRVAGGEGAGLVRGQEELLLSALVNVAGNAVKYSRPGGRVFLRAWREKDRAKISVTDTGAGTDAGERDRAGSEEGHGLGLSICRRVLEAHRGTLSAVSGAGRGRTFVLSLPARVEGSGE